MPPARSSSTHRHTHVVLAIVALGIVLRAAILLTYERDVDGDEAVVGIMALRIQQDREHFLFWPGRPYNGGAAINAYLAALAFRLLGPSAVALKAPALLWSLGALLAGDVFARRFAGPTSALWTLLLLAFGPAVFCRWGAKCYLGTVATFINLAIAYAFLRSLFGVPSSGGLVWGPAVGRSDSGPRPPKAGTPNCGTPNVSLLLWPFLTGVLCGLGYYNSPFIVPMLFACAVFGVLVRRDFVRRRGFWTGVLGLAVGMAPAIVALARGSTEELAPRVGLEQLGTAIATAAIKVPYFFGQPYRYFGSPPLPVSGLIGFVAAAGGLVAAAAGGARRMGAAAVAAWRGRAQDPPALARAFALLFVAAHAGAFVLSPQDVQYLLPAYPFAALLVAMALSEVRWRALGLAFGIAAVLANVWSALTLTTAGRNGFDKYVDGDVECSRLVAFLEANDLRAVYASSAIAHVLTFTSQRQVVAVSYDAVFAEDVRRVHRAERYAYVFATGSEYDARLRAHLARRRIGCQTAAIGPWTVRYGLEAEVRPEDVSWRTDYLGCFPSRVDLWQSALRLDPWRVAYQCRLLEAQRRAAKPVREPTAEETQ